MTRTFDRFNWYTAVLLVLAAIGLLASNAAASEPAVWTTDAAHTEINFSITHFFTPVTGSFADYEIDLDYNAEQP